MSDIRKYEGLPIIPEMFSNALPAPVPQLTWGTGIIGGIIHNIKLGQIERASEREANISQHRLNNLNAQIESMITILTAGQKADLAFRQVEHDRRMMELEESRELETIIKLRTENEIAKWQAKMEELEFKQREKEMTSDSEIEDRTET